MKHGARGLAAAAIVGVALLGVRPAQAALSYQQFTSLNLGGDDAPVWAHDGSAVFYSTRATGFPYIFRKALGTPMNSTGVRLTSWNFDEYQATVSSDDAWVMLCVGDTLNARHLWRCPGTGGAPLSKVTYGPFYDIDPDWYGSSSGLVAFASNRGGAGYQIWTLVPNGTLPALALTQVTDAGHNDFHPSFSPDGQKIVFSSDRGGGTQLFVTTWNGSTWGPPVQFTTGSGAKTCPDWSLNGLHIAYEVSNGSGASELWVIDSDGSNARLVTSAGSYDARPGWSNSGNQLAFVSDRSGAKYIWLADGLATPSASDTWGRVKALYRR
jgi:Tol biopolymer transport system component